MVETSSTSQHVASQRFAHTLHKLVKDTLHPYQCGWKGCRTKLNSIHTLEKVWTMASFSLVVTYHPLQVNQSGRTVSMQQVMAEHFDHCNKVLCYVNITPSCSGLEWIMLKPCLLSYHIICWIIAFAAIDSLVKTTAMQFIQTYQQFYSSNYYSGWLVSFSFFPSRKTFNTKHIKIHGNYDEVSVQMM